ncbi:MAG TPA: glycoside hydrolase family 2 TIM barrel-domain containing protein, partial [Tepidisphaeraceae bacterium]|nr:glycoside hydrolase family 2 TIM barrel-domain containing protein [Tepidisphaeraceae bacterium]
MLLVGGNWKVQSASLVLSSPKQIARAEFDDRQWVPATVPGTVLSSYLDAGKIPDPYYADQRYQIDDAFFTDNDFWYRDTFAVPKEFTGHRIWLNFDGINWKADIFVNGSRVGRIDGAFLRGRFDVTPLVKPGEKMCLAVLVHKVAHPGEVKHKSLAKWPPNGGILGLDSPTFVSSIGWNWLPTIPGRNVGIWNDVWLSSSGDVSIVDPFVTTELPSPDVAEITARVELVNHSNQPQDGTVHGAIDNIEFSSPISLAASETKTITFDKTNCPQLVIRNPKLWWPNGMGDQPIYHLKLRVDLANVTSDAKEIPFGIRKLTYQTHDNVLFIYCNGQRVLLRGGNWGMDEGMLRCDDAGYELRVRLHKEMNFTMIRNWVGMTGRDGFYNACDKYGILIWDDFWLANPADGPDPSDEAMFMTNARDKIRRVRNHPSLALYCGRNEGYPPKSLDEQLHAATKELDPTRKYLSHSAADGATGFGPYDVHAPEWYFEHRGMTLHSELGIVAVPPVETLRTFLPPDKLWPINDLWGQHDLSQERGPAYMKRLNDSYGEASSVEDFCRKAQLLNLESAKAMLECWQSHQGSGGLIWMTQSAWPCLICQAYTYELEPTGAYFGFKKACEPVHILRDSYTNRIKAANDTP